MSRLMAEEASLHFEQESVRAEARDEARFARLDARELQNTIATIFGAVAVNAQLAAAPRKATEAA